MFREMGLAETCISRSCVFVFAGRSARGFDTGRLHLSPGQCRHYSIYGSSRTSMYDFRAETRLMV